MAYSSAYAPVPSPARAGEGCPAGRGGEWVVFPRACALGYNLPPLTGLRSESLAGQTS
jgi:hypothetical protein